MDTRRIDDLASRLSQMLPSQLDDAREDLTRNFRAVLKEMYADVKGGMSLSGAMQQHPAAFNEAYVNSVAAGEASGTLEQFLGNLSEFIEADLELKSDVRGALLYPAILIGSLGLSVATLIIFVVLIFFQNARQDAIDEEFGHDE